MVAMRIVILVSITALAGMVMGGLFGLASGAMAPEFFAAIVPWLTLEPLGIATVLGGIAGVSLGGGLGVFAVLIEFLRDRTGPASQSKEPTGA